MNDIVLVGIALVVVLVGGFAWMRATLAARVWSVAQSELAKARAREAEERQERQDAALEAIRMLVNDIRRYHGELAAELRRKTAEAERRASVAERDTSEVTTVALDLVTELRAFRDTLGTRARVAEREATEAASVLTTAFELVDELRALREGTEPVPLRVPERRPPPVPRARAPLPPESEPEEGQPAPGAEEKKS